MQRVISSDFQARWPHCSRSRFPDTVFIPLLASPLVRPAQLTFAWVLISATSVPTTSEIERCKKTRDRRDSSPPEPSPMHEFKANLSVEIQSANRARDWRRGKTNDGFVLQQRNRVAKVEIVSVAKSRGYMNHRLPW